MLRTNAIYIKMRRINHYSIAENDCFEFLLKMKRMKWELLRQPTDFESVKTT
jgi:hypothetical protein